MSKLLFPIFVLLGVVSGDICKADEPRREDVTENKKWWGGYEPGKEYVTSADLFLVGDKTAIQSLFPPETNTGMADASSVTSWVTPTFEAYKKDPKKYPFVQGILAKDTQLQVTKIELFSATTHSKIIIYAKIVGGEFSKQTIFVNSVSLVPGVSKGKPVENLLLLEPNPAYLKKAKE